MSGASAAFHRDPHPGRPRILFVGLGESSHTQGWIDLLADAEFNVRLFALPSGLPPARWPVRTYVTAGTGEPLDPATRRRLYPRRRALRYPLKAYVRVRRPQPPLEERFLARALAEWRPDVVHTLGVAPAGAFYDRVRRLASRAPKWVLQTRGGSDLELVRHDPVAARALAAIMSASDRVLCDNPHNLDIARALGVPDERFGGFGPVPGSGGVDVDALGAGWRGPPSGRERIIVWPKAYECPWSKALPVFEALLQCWQRIAPCRVHMLAMDEEARAWFAALPEAIREHCVTHERVPRGELLALMQRARVVLAPSLIDGLPNTLYEAMAAGAFPIVSPLPTIAPFVTPGRNVLFARNLYPDEIAVALVRSMTDDRLVDDAATRNVALVRATAHRPTVARRVVALYEELAGGPRAVANAHRRAAEVPA